MVDVDLVVDETIELIYVKIDMVSQTVREADDAKNNAWLVSVNSRWVYVRLRRQLFVEVRYNGRRSKNDFGGTTLPANVSKFSPVF